MPGVPGVPGDLPSEKGLTTEAPRGRIAVTMKTRNGFVSNSSSSSFVVVTRESKLDLLINKIDREPKILLTKRQIAWLEKTGFVYCEHTYASRVEQMSPLQYPGEKPASVPKAKASHMYYSVDCNESDVIESLVSRGIPFTAACHYGHNTVVFDGGKGVYQLPNVGVEYETYGESLGPISTKKRFKILSQSVEDVKENGWDPK
jgi:hypothetical protein